MQKLLQALQTQLNVLQQQCINIYEYISDKMHGTRTNWANTWIKTKVVLMFTGNVESSFDQVKEV